MADLRSERRHRRLDGKYKVVFRRPENPIPFRGVATNLSTGGMFLASPDSQPLGSRLEIRFDESGKEFVAQGEVVHSVESGMGIRFVPIRELLSQLVLSDSEAPDEKRESSELLAELGRYRVSFKDRTEFGAVFDRDLKTGGLFVATQHPATPGAEIKIEIAVAGVAHEPLLLQGRMVKAVSGGMGVEILNLQTALPHLSRLRPG